LKKKLNMERETFPSPFYHATFVIGTFFLESSPRLADGVRSRRCLFWRIREGKFAKHQKQIPRSVRKKRTIFIVATSLLADADYLKMTLLHRCLQGVPYVRGRSTTYIYLNWLEISKSTLDMMYSYMMTTFTAKISALGQPSSEYCNAQQIAPKTLLLTLTNFRKSRKMSNSQFPKKTSNELC
jgi:hypothetical protein